MPFHLGPWEIGLILVILLLIFGVGKLPQIGGVIGKTLKEFRRTTQEINEDAESVAEKKKVDIPPAGTERRPKK